MSRSPAAEVVRALRRGLPACLIVPVLFGMATSAWAQTPAPAAPPPGPALPAGVTEPNWEIIRKAALSTIDQQTVQKWAAARMDQAFTGSKETIPPPALSFFNRIRDELRNPASVAAYKAGLAQIAADAFVSRYQALSSTPAEGRSPLGLAFVMIAMRELAPFAPASNPGFVNAFQAALVDPAPAIRTQAIIGLASKEVRAAIPAATRAAVLESVRKAALTEADSTALSRMYSFITATGDTLTQPQDLTPVAKAVLDILEARLGRIEQRAISPAPADALAVAWLAAKVRTLNNPQTQTALVRDAARLLADTAYQYANEAPAGNLKEDLERTALLAEEQLTLLYKAKVPNGQVPTPALTAVMTQGGAKLKENVADGITKWIGAGNTPGVLNPPQAFGFPNGLGIQRPVPTTASAPA